MHPETDAIPIGNFQAILGVGARLLSAKDPDALLAGALASLLPALEADVLAIQCVEGLKLIVEERFGLDDGQLAALDGLEWSRTACRPGARVTDITHVDRAGIEQHPERAIFDRLGLRSALRLPLVAAGEPLGVLLAGSRTRDALSAQTRGTSQLIATVVSAVKERRNRLFMQHATDAMFLHDESGAIVDVNPQACLSLGLTREQLLGRLAFDFDPQITVEALAGLLARLEKGETTFIETSHRHASGHEFPVEIRVRPFWRRGRRYGLASVRDISKRRGAEAQLRRAQAVAHMGSFEYDLGSDTLSLSDEALRMNGWGAGMYREADLLALCHPDDLAELLARWRGARRGTPFAFRYRRVVNGRLEWIDMRVEPERDGDGRVMRLTGVSQDVTAAAHVQEQLLHAQRLESVGQMASGIAHDFNNLLTVIHGATEIVRDHLGPEAPVREEVAAIRDAIRQAAQLTRKLLAFTRTQSVDPVALDINDILSGVRRLLRRSIREDITLVEALEPEPAWLRADQGQLEQVILNLALNARDAIDGPGTIRLVTQNVTVDASNAAEHHGVSAGSWVMFGVQDTGRGMTPEVQARAFDPFFTTRTGEEGAGLGLTIVESIVSQAGGVVRLESRPGHGTSCRVYLPAAGAPEGEVAPEEAAGTVLVVEDEEAVRRLTCRSLESRGFTVISVPDADAALALDPATMEDVDVVVTDVVMPGIGGGELSRRLVERYPFLRVLYMSGYEDTITMRYGVSRLHDDLLSKPFGPTDLAARVRKAMATPPA